MKKYLIISVMVLLSVIMASCDSFTPPPVTTVTKTTTTTMPALIITNTSTTTLSKNVVTTITQVTTLPPQTITTTTTEIHGDSDWLYPAKVEYPYTKGTIRSTTIKVHNGGNEAKLYDIWVEPFFNAPDKGHLVAPDNVGDWVTITCNEQTAIRKLSLEIQPHEILDVDISLKIPLSDAYNFTNAWEYLVHFNVAQVGGVVVGGAIRFVVTPS